jgi:membrane-associated protease RseP (regulator of RpoE activity)
VVLLPTTVMSVLGGIRPVGGFFLANLLLVNVSLAAFNLIPAFPMDGGRVLRALLALRRDYVSATQTAATVGQALALAFGFLGLLYNPLLIFIALFVWMGASEEASAAQLRSALAGIPLSRAMITDFRTLSPHDPLARAVTHVIAGFQQDFPVVDASGAVVGVLTQPALLKSLAQHGESGLVEESMDRHFVAAAPEEMVDRVFVRLAECACRSLPVVAAGRLVGMVTPDNVGEFIMIQTALGNARQHQLAAQAVGAH